MTPSDRGETGEFLRAVALGMSVFLLVLLFFSPSWVAFRAWARVPDVFSRSIPVARGAYAAMQLADPSVEITEPVHRIVRWRLLMPVVGHYLGLPPWMVLGLSYVGCVAVLVLLIRLGRRRAYSWTECAMLAVVMGAAGWFFTSTGWLGYYDSWLVLGLLIVAWARSRWLLWLACALTPWVDERFVLGFPLALLVRWIDASSTAPAGHDTRWVLRDVLGAGFLVATYVALRLWLAGQGGSPSLAEYWTGVESTRVPRWRLLFGSWEGLRLGWIPVLLSPILLFWRRRVLAALLLALGVGGTVVAGLATANDLSRSMALVVPAVPLGWDLARTRSQWTRWRLGPVLAALALLLPANHVISTFTVPVEQLWHEVRLLIDPPPPFSATAYEQEAANAINQGDLGRAETLATIATRLAPDAVSHNLRGVVMARQGRWADALQEFDAAVRADPLMTDALMNRARARAARGDVAGARQDAQRVRDLSAPQSALATQAAEFLDATAR